MDKPKLSIITINFNDKIGLKKTMQSVFDQTFRDFEYIIIDGGSTDGSRDLIEQSSQCLAYWVSEQDKGVFHAQNKGVMVANGEYVLFLNGGDVLNGNTALEDFISHENFDGDIIYGDYKFEEGEKIYPDELTSYYFMKTSLPHQSTLFKKQVFEKMGQFDEKYKFGADRAFFIKCFMDGSIKFQHIKYPLTVFDLQGLSNDPKLLSEKRAEDEAIFEECFGPHYKELVAQREADAMLSRAKRNSLKGIIKRIKRRLSR